MAKSRWLSRTTLRLPEKRAGRAARSNRGRGQARASTRRSCPDSSRQKKRSVAARHGASEAPGSPHLADGHRVAGGLELVEAVAVERHAGAVHRDAGPGKGRNRRGQRERENEN